MRPASSGENSTSWHFDLACAHRPTDHLQDFLARLVQLVLKMNVGGGEKGVDARPRGILQRFPGAVDVKLIGPRQRGDDGPPDFRRDGLDGFKVAVRGDGESRLPECPRPAGRVGGPSRFSPAGSCCSPGDCSPSRSVVSKMKTFSGILPPRRQGEMVRSLWLNRKCPTQTNHVRTTCRPSTRP